MGASTIGRRTLRARRVAVRQTRRPSSLNGSETRLNTIMHSIYNKCAYLNNATNNINYLQYLVVSRIGAVMEFDLVE